MAELDWRVWRLGAFKYEEHVAAEEGRVCIWSLERDLNSVQFHHKRLLRLVDNISVALAFSLCRFPSLCLLQLNRKLAAIALATTTLVSCRWFPSEMILANEPSRRLERFRGAVSLERFYAVPQTSREGQGGHVPSWRAAGVFQPGRPGWHDFSSSAEEDADPYGASSSSQPVFERAPGRRGDFTCVAARNTRKAAQGELPLNSQPQES